MCVFVFSPTDRRPARRNNTTKMPPRNHSIIGVTKSSCGALVFNIVLVLRGALLTVWFMLCVILGCLVAIPMVNNVCCGRRRSAHTTAFFRHCFVAAALWLFLVAHGGVQFRSPDVPRILCSLYSPVSAWLAGITTRHRDWHLTTVQGSAIYVANHQTYLDLSFFGQVCAPAFSRARGEAHAHTHPLTTRTGARYTRRQSLPKNTVCVAKSTLKYIPLFGLFWYAAGNIFVDRQRRNVAIKSMDATAQRLRDGSW